MSHKRENYYQYRLNKSVQKVQMPVAFVPDIVLILNVTDANLYIKTGSIRVPTPDNYDLLITPYSYYIFQPYRETREYAGFLDNPTAWDALIWFSRGFGLLKKDLTADLTLGLNVQLNPMPDPTVHAFFTYTVL